MNLEIASTGSAHNYTRSYYMNGRDYIISGSCDEHVVRICCAQTGKRLRDVYLEVLYLMRMSEIFHLLRGHSCPQLLYFILFCRIWSQEIRCLCSH